MSPEKAEKLFMLMKQYGVTQFKNDDLEIKMDGGPATLPIPINIQEPTKEIKVPPNPAAAPPVDMKIPHHVNEVARLLKLSDNDLVDEMFPDYSQIVDGEAV